ncbi:SoxR reducing system RseC family protein [Thiorhodovibrio frisius]|uniref:Positive regulator of sigma E activity n=1 Tax=Thiorhodovibrio frisius TaxID=631362 RepID=H8Z279_9GAMM|nr:SoxR reducing system RseC family protein [Thiorhodovibrio frisius]EIC22641.1 Positive regulator of sigma E activity [Thiorhodovibrio frisius]WPL22397.1 Sigma-E factor regulatory protein RseC [Thiorhodovibrio frisius]
MIEEQAIVIAVDDRFAEVEPQRRATCDHCGVKGACGTSLIDRFLGRRPVRLRVTNAIGARVGERVILGVADAVLLRAAVVAYLVPLLGLLLGAALALELADWRQWPGAQSWSLGGGVLGFALSLRWVADYSRRLRGDPRYRAVLLGRAEPPAESANQPPNETGSGPGSAPLVSLQTHHLRT